MTPKDKKRLTRLQEIAEIKAGIALGELSALTGKRQALTDQMNDLLAHRAKILGNDTDVEGAALLANWVRLAETQQRALSIQLASLQADINKSMQSARQEEGRRQVLQKLRS